MTDPTRTSWLTVTLCLAAGVIAAFQVGKAPIALTDLRQDLGIGLAQASWVLSALALVGAALGVVMGSLVSRWGPRPMLLIGLAVMAVASGAGAVAPGLGLLVTSRVAEGFGLLLVVIAAPALITRLSAPHDRPLVFALWGCFMPFGMALAMLGAPFLSTIGWRGLWLVMAALTLVMLLLAWARLPHPEPLPLEGEPQHLGRDLLTLLISPGPRLLAAIFACYTTCWFILAGFLPTLLSERLGLDPGHAGLLTALVVGSNIFGNLATGPLLQRHVPRRRLMMTALGVIGLSSLAIFNPATPSGLAYLACVLFAATGGLLPGSVFGAAALVAPSRRLVPVSLGLVMQGSNLGQLVGPALGGAVVAAFGWESARLVLVAVVLLGLSLSLRLRGA